MIGPIGQELLSGINELPQFQSLRTQLRAFPDLALQREDFEEAAQLFNQCRSRGILGFTTDFLICAVALRRRLSIYTADARFTAFQSVARLTLHVTRN